MKIVYYYMSYYYVGGTSIMCACVRCDMLLCTFAFAGAMPGFYVCVHNFTLIYYIRLYVCTHRVGKGEEEELKVKNNVCIKIIMYFPGAL